MTKRTLHDQVSDVIESLTLGTSITYHNPVVRQIMDLIAPAAAPAGSIADYYTVEAENSAQLDRQVKEALAEGWQLLGSVAVAQSVYERTDRDHYTETVVNTLFVQALVKYGDK